MCVRGHRGPDMPSSLAECQSLSKPNTQYRFNNDKEWNPDPDLASLILLMNLALESKHINACGRKSSQEYKSGMAWNKHQRGISV